MSQIALIFGTGANVGGHVAHKFLDNGYKVATVSRSAKSSLGAEFTHFAADMSDPKSVADVFGRVKQSLGPPEVVIYNAAAKAPEADKNDPLALSVDALENCFAVNTISAFAAAQEAVKIFKELPASASRSFIYTGNVLNTRILPGFESLGMGKAASAHFIESAASVYAEQGLKFYYCDERTPDGGPVYADINGAAHAALYYDLSNSSSQGPWHQTFVKGKGYQKF